MVTGEQVKVEGATTEAPATEEASQTKTLTQSELDALVAKAKEEGEQAALEKYKGIQRTISKKDGEIKQLRAQYAQPLSDALAATLEELKGLQSGDTGDDLTTQARTQRIAALQQKLKREQQLAIQERVVQSKRDELNQRIIEAGYDPSNDIFADVDEAFDMTAALDGKFERVEKKLARILDAHKKTKDEKPVEDEAKLRERLEREILEKHGLLKSEKVSASSSGGRYWTPEQIDKMSIPEYAAHKKEIDEAERAGRIRRK